MGEALSHDWRGRRVAISGAAGGLGQALARKFDGAGASLLLVDRDAKALDALRSGFARPVETLACDQSSARDVETFFERAGELAVFINNAGVTVRKPLEAMRFEDLHAVFDTNVVGAIAMAIAAARRMLAAGSGVIVNVCSQLAYKTSPGSAAYGASKSALVHFTATAAAEWIGRGVRVAGLAPGPIDTPMIKELQADPAAASRLLAGMPIGRLLSADEVAAIALFLASPAAQSFVGQTLIADGGNLL